MKNLLFVISIMVLASCATTAKFPVSEITPAALITAKLSKDKHNNNAIAIKAKNLSSPDRLTPAKQTYVVWINTKDNGIKNVGQLQNKNAQTATLKTVTSFNVTEIIITAEDAGDVSYPAGIEISRTSID